MRAPLLVLLSSLALSSSSPIKETPSQRAQAMLAQMNLTEKIDIVHGYSGHYVGNVPANTRLGIPALNLNDGPQGFRGIAGTSTCWPSGLTTATTWNVETMKAWGVAMGKEFVGKGSNVQLGPGVCLARVPVNGRNFEYLSGEDPFLGYTLVQPVITGIQSQGVIANAKHYVNNNQETNRGSVSENVDERTEFEMYLPVFEGAVKAGVQSVMCSYNKINNVYSCENNVTLGYLKNDLKFAGWVMSDWGATHSTVPSALAGLDQQMPDAGFFGPALLAAIQSGEVPQSVLDDKVLRILTAMYTVGLFDKPNTGNLNNNVTSEAHNTLAREIAAEAMVLLQNNDNLLPLPTTGKIAVIGDACQVAPIVHGGGSGSVSPPYVITPLAGVTTAAPSATVTYFQTNPIAAAAAGAAAAEVAIICTATTSSEGHDRANLSLPIEEVDLIYAVAKAQPKSVVVVSSPGAVLLPFAPEVASIISTFMPGQEAGNAIADVLFGKVNPSGKLPLTFPMEENQPAFAPDAYPGLPTNNPAQADYTEKLLVGYRWFDANSVAPRFPFGHGLSYTSFTYSQLTASASQVTVQIANSGNVNGAEVAQLYIGFPAVSGEPPQQLKGFQKVSLTPGALTTVSFDLKPRDLSIWDVEAHAWSEQHGTFAVYVGSSSRDIRLKGQFNN